MNFEKVNEPGPFGEEVYLSEEYQVNVEILSDGVTWLSIKRKDKECIHDWRELQRIKNALCGPEREALELYPAESRLVDTSNQFHLFVLPEGQFFPYGYTDRVVVKGRKGGFQKAGQRDFQPDECPTDAMEPEEADKKAAEYLQKKREGGEHV